MTDTRPNWQLQVSGELPAEEAGETIDLITELLQEDVDEVLRGYISDLILTVRTLRDNTKRVQAEADPQAKSIVLFEKQSREGVKGVTLEKYIDTTLEAILDIKVRLHDLQFYAVALAEKRSAMNDSA